jgi:fructose-1-phosphate kinase PfkB-like protein
MKPNREEFYQLTSATTSSAVFSLAQHSALTFGRAGAVLIHEGECLYAQPPTRFDTNPIGAGDAFAAAYLRCLLDRQRADDCFRFAIAAAASDAATLRPGVIDVPQLHMLAGQVELRFLSRNTGQLLRR